MKRIIPILMTVLMFAMLTACGSNSQPGTSSGIGRSGSNMEALAGTGTWLEGKRFDGDVTEEELQSWIEGLK
ncbi:MAG: hypothetical protein Q4F51_08875 [Sarcina sp.]|nr:hypothetical protein [Sarcina sp.]